MRADYAGGCSFDGVEVSAWDRRKLARRTAFVPQSLRLEFPFTVEQVVYMGRTPYCNGLFESAEDRTAVRRAMELADVAGEDRKDDDQGPHRDRDPDRVEVLPRSALVAQITVQNSVVRMPGPPLGCRGSLVTRK